MICGKTPRSCHKIHKDYWTAAVINHALKSNGIPSIRIDKGRKGNAAKLFDQDPGLRVMLLHGEHENAGLNIVCASRMSVVLMVIVLFLRSFS